MVTRGDGVKVMTTRFGAIEIDDDRIIEMPDGMLGFEERRFILLLPDNNGQFFWFQSVDDPALAFVVTDPTAFVPGYEVKLTPDEYEKLQLDPESAEVVLLAVTNITREAKSMTINLQGPIVVNPAKMTAKQVVLEYGKYGVQHPLFADAEAGREEAAVSALEKITAICGNI